MNNFVAYDQSQINVFQAQRDSLPQPFLIMKKMSN